MIKEIKIETLGNYYPKKGDSIYFDNFSQAILDLKRKKEAAIEYFFENIKDHLTQESIMAITVVPSHSPNTKLSGISILANKLAEYHHWIDATAYLYRKHHVDQLSKGGNRSIETHLNSIDFSCLDTRLNIENILLIDDVKTTGNSLKACANILYQHGIENVRPVALAKAIRYLD